MKTIYDNPNRCTENHCTEHHCAVCRKHLSGPVWGKSVCGPCIKAHHKGQINGTLTQDDINKWEGAFRVTELVGRS